jgi:hypothetical protein
VAGAFLGVGLLYFWMIMHAWRVMRFFSRSICRRRSQTAERRRSGDRRQAPDAAYAGPERRSGIDRRRGVPRRVEDAARCRTLSETARQKPILAGQPQAPLHAAQEALVARRSGAAR